MKKYVIIYLLFVIYTITAQNNPVIQEISKNEFAKYSTLGNVVSGKLLKSLKSELMIAIKEGGIAAAINRCNLMAIPLTQDLIKSDNKIKRIKRTTKKYRNPANSPDVIEIEALNYFENNFENPDNEYIQKILLHDSTFYNYYQSIKIGEFCLKCHGTEEKMDKEVVELTAKLYPEDKAKDYEVGDLRGAIKITFIK